MGCKARIAISLEDSGKWQINSVHLEHNHGTSPSKSRLYRCNRKVSSNVKRMLEVNDVAGIPLHKSFNSTVVEACGYNNLEFIERDCRNYIQKVRWLRLGEGDAAAIQAYFSKMQAQSPGFYFSIDLDEDSRLKNVFWADNQCRQMYKEFGDVITFDTTYLTNKYDMPFTPFIGVNHHGESTLFGCGLVSSEDTELFQTWLKCMHDEAPSGIITDQDRAMQNAIQVVFPHTKHRWCLWHILNKLPEKFGYHVERGSILTAVNGLVYDSQDPEEFESGWIAMTDMYDLHDNDWLSGFYENRERWVPCFLKISFWARMSTTQRSESMNAFFDGYVHSKTSLKLFFEQYERAMRSKVEKEFQSDFKSFSQMIPYVTTYEIETQFQSIYITAKFKEFKMSSLEKCIARSSLANEGLLEQCIRGIVCKLAISVLIRNDVRKLPKKYILRRWRRDVNRSYSRVMVNYDGLVSSTEHIWYAHLCKSFAKLADLAADDQERTRFLLDWIECQLNDYFTMKGKASRGGNIPFQQSVKAELRFEDVEKMDNRNILDPQCLLRKGAPKKHRIKSAL